MNVKFVKQFAMVLVLAHYPILYNLVINDSQLSVTEVNMSFMSRKKITQLVDFQQLQIDSWQSSMNTKYISY